MVNNDNYNGENVTRFPSPGERARREGHKKPREPIFNLPPVTQGLTLLMLGVFALRYVLPEDVLLELMFQAGLVPARYTGGLDLGIAGFVSPFTHMFLHADWLHLGLNVGTFLAFGTAIERENGGRRMLLLFFLTGLCGALVHLILHPYDQLPLIGASGAISGLFGAVLVMARDKGLMGTGRRGLLPFILLWIGVSVFFGTFGMPGEEASIAWATHVGGFLAGIALYRPIARMKMQH